ncbi:hypothetical protein ZWY2020_001415 [Hordeum vulgare]|nr:hypothetical protein ZWY2020_001415 [Hordeum vulgare]
MPVHAHKKVGSGITDHELARKKAADRHLPSAAAPAPPPMIININHYGGNVNILVQGNQERGGASSSAAPSSQPHVPLPRPGKAAMVVQPAEASKPQRNHPVQSSKETRQTHREPKPSTETTIQTHTVQKKHPVQPPMKTTRKTHREQPPSAGAAKPRPSRSIPATATATTSSSGDKGGTPHHNNPGSTQATVSRVPCGQYRARR